MNMIFMIVSNVELLFKGGKSDGFFIVDGVVFDGFEFFVFELGFEIYIFFDCKGFFW